VAERPADEHEQALVALAQHVARGARYRSRTQGAHRHDGRADVDRAEAREQLAGAGSGEGKGRETAREVGHGDGARRVAGGGGHGGADPRAVPGLAEDEHPRRRHRTPPRAFRARRAARLEPVATARRGHEPGEGVGCGLELELKQVRAVGEGDVLGE
jgi:hypothetical protein